MYFDRQTHRLVKLGNVTHSDYQTFDGLPIARREHDGHFEPEVTGFRVVDKSTLPHKVWNECIRCPKFVGCTEIAVVYDLAPQALQLPVLG